MRTWIAALIILIFLQLPLRAVESAQQPPPPGAGDPPAVVQIEYADPQQLRELATVLDVWEVHPDQGRLVAALHPGQFERLAAAGVRIQTDLLPALAYAPETIPDYPCYRTIEELGALVQQMAAEHPEQAELLTIGASYEGRPLWVLRITDENTPGPKPALFVLANLHGRELITPEVALAFADYLIHRDGTEADVTWLLDHQEVYILASANPDGHIRNEAGFPWRFWRKNTQPYGVCTAETIGVDLNRNFPLQWGCCAGSSGDPCDETYRGPAAGSEPELQAIQAALRGLFSGGSQAGRAGQGTAGMLVDLHSYGNLVLYPWAWTGSPAPEEPALQAIAEQLAGFNGYLPLQASDLYPADGTADDWAYGELGVAAFTFEIGDSFFPACSQQAALIEPNVRALLYAAKLSRRPFELGRGPRVLSLTVAGAQGNGPVLTASISGRGGVPIQAAEFTIDTPPWAGGQPYLLGPADGVLDQSEEILQAELAETLGGDGRHLIYVRGQDADGFWGPVTAVFYGYREQIFLPFLIRNASEAK